jgi:glutamate---cysteine ligase / carboxylate-amine ligase
MTGLTRNELQSLTEAQLRAAFDRPEPMTIGIEEEVKLLEPQTLDLAPVAPRLLERLDGDPRFKAELPASQIEIVTPPLPAAADAVEALRAGRRDLATAAEGLARPAGMAVHPFAPAQGELSRGERYDRTREEYGPVARRQLVSALQVHVAVGDAEHVLGVYNVLRGHLPELAALAANGAFYEGVDSGLASVRPKVSEGLPRQGMPPPLASWDEFAGELRWGARAGTVVEPRSWWWELRPHIEYGTLELRVPDTQTTVDEAAGVIALCQSLVAWLLARARAGEEMRPAPTWRIEENRWSACRWGVEGRMADLRTGEPEPTRDRLSRLIAAVSPHAAELGSLPLLERASALVEENGAMRQRRVGASGGAAAVAASHADRFLA